MDNQFSSINLGKVRQLRQFKLDYSHVHNLEYIDKDRRLPQSFVEYRRLVPPAPLVIEEQTRPTLPSDLRYLQNYSTQ
jgi:hypothetical protein